MIEKRDPTDNVMMLVEMATRRLDDLRASDLAGMKALQEAHYNRLEALQEASSKRLDDQLQLHIDHIMDRMNYETKRIDAIRVVDVGAVAVASEKATQQAGVLASQVTASAETLRTLVATTAATTQQQQQQTTTQLIDRLMAVEKFQYESKGSSGIPTQVLERLNDLERTGNIQKGRSGLSSSFLAAIATFVGGLIVFMIQRNIN